MALEIRGFAFDLEGTLVDLELAHHLGHLAAAHELGLKLTLDEAREQLRSFVGGPDLAVATELRDLARTSVPVTRILERTRHHFRTFQTRRVRPRPGVRRFLRQASRKGLLMAIGSVTPRDEGCALLEAAGLAGYFPDGLRVFLEDVRRPKPAPDVYLETAKRCGLTPSEQVVFEDSPTGIQSARRAGSPAVAVPAVTNATIRPRLRQAGATVIFDDWMTINVGRVLVALEVAGIHGQ